MAGLKIKDAPLIDVVKGTDKVPASNNSGKAVALSVQQIKEFTLSGLDLDPDIYIIVTALPTTDIKINKIYLVPNKQETGENVYTEYLYVDSKWEILGEYKAEVDLAPYAKTTYVDSEIGKVTSRVDSIETTVGAIDQGLVTLLGE